MSSSFLRKQYKHKVMGDQFPQPTRPISSYNPNPVNSEPLQLHQTSISKPVIDCSKSSQYSRTLSSEEMVSPFVARTPKEEVEAVEELVMILIDCLEELNTKSRAVLLKKLFSEIEKEVSMGRFIIERLRNSRVKAISELLQKLPDEIGSCQVNSDGSVINVQRDINDVVGDDSMPTRSVQQKVEDLYLKLEKFKVRTPDLGLGEVVKEEEKK